MSESNFNLPQWSLFYFFKNLKPFRALIIVSVIISCLSAILSYIIAKQIQHIVNNYQTINISEIVVLLLILVFVKELLGYFTRIKSEAFVIKFKDFIRTKLLSDIVKQINYYDNDPNELKSATNEYLSTCYYLSSTFVLGLAGKLTSIIISFVIIYSMGTIPLLLNISVLIVFFVASYFFSKQYVGLSKVYGKYSIALETIISNMFLSVDYISRNKIRINQHNDAKKDKWDQYDKVKMLHGKRWFWQLLPFNMIYIITLGFLLSRIQNGQNELGDIILAQWYYSILLGSFVFVTESLTDLTKLKATSEVAFEKIETTIGANSRESFYTLDISPSQSHLIQGSNGSGKTTALYKFIKESDSSISSYFSGEHYPILSNLSSGEQQKQKVMECAQRSADIYIFDEPCSYSDDTEWFLNVLYLLKGKTVIVTSHINIDYDFDNIILEHGD